MASTRDIRRKIRSVNSTMQITKAFELVSTAKLRRARVKLDASERYFDTLKNVLSDVLEKDIDRHNIYLKPSEMKKPLVILLTSDRGLCGGFNINAIKSALEIQGDVKYYTIGKKGTDYVVSRKLNGVGRLHNATERPQVEHANHVAKEALRLYESGEVDSVILVYSQFVSTISFTPKHLQLLPLQANFESKDESKHGRIEVLNFVPSRDEVLRAIMPKYIAGLIYGAMIESSASEQAARRLAMESATGNAEEIIDELTLTYNQARQAAITQELSEIVGGAEALS